MSTTDWRIDWEPEGDAGFATHLPTGVRFCFARSGLTGCILSDALRELKRLHGDDESERITRTLISELVLLPVLREERTPALLPDWRVLH